LVLQNTETSSLTATTSSLTAITPSFTATSSSYTATSSLPKSISLIKAISNQSRSQWLKRTCGLKLATFNARTLKSNFRQYELKTLAIKLNIDVIMLQEHRIIVDNSNSTNVDIGDGWSLWLSTASSAGHGGIGFLYSPKMKAALLEVRRISERLAVAVFQLRTSKLRAFSGYAPTSSSSAADPKLLEDFLEMLSSEFLATPSRDVMVLGADLNACLPRDGIVVMNRCGRPNFNAPHVADTLSSLGLIAANGHARTRYRQLPTFNGPQQRCTRLDYLLIHENRRHLISRVQYVTPRIIVSDHRLVALTIRIPPPYRPTSKPPTFHNWGYMRNPDKVAQFDDYLSTQSPPTSYSDFINIVKAGADELLPPAQRGAPTVLDILCHSLSPESDLVDSLRHAIVEEKRLQHGARDQMTTAYEKAREKLLSTIINQLQQHSEDGQQRKIWQIVNSLSKRHQRPQSVLPALTLSDRLNQFQSHFSRVLNQPPAPPQRLLCPPGLSPLSTDKFNCGPITQREIVTAAKSFSKFKAFGPDGISAAIFKSHSALCYLRVIMNLFLTDGQIPAEWLESSIVAIPKKQNALTLDNFRGISLMSVSTKLFNKILLRRLVPLIDPLLLPWQSGFRPRRSTIEQITALRLIIDRCKARKKDVVIVFIDFSKAFDSVDRDALSQIIRLYGVPEELVSPMMSLYNGTKATVRTPDGSTVPFITTSGILQGDTLAPFLFVVVMDFVLRTALLPLAHDSFMVSPATGLLPALAYADDIALLANDFVGAEKMVNSLAAVASTVGLHINFGKTEVLPLTSIQTPNPPLPSFPLIKACSDFTYLGSLMFDSMKAFAQRRRLAWLVTKSLNPIFTSSVSGAVKIRLFRAVVEPVLLYGCESWVISKTQAETIDASHRAILRTALNIRWPMIIKNTDLYALPDIKPASELMRYRRLILFGKATRAEPLEHPIAIVLRHQPTEKHRRRGRPPTTMWSLLEDDLRHLGLSFAEAWSAAVDVKRWMGHLGGI
jgi:hypothetical protein